ncbi:hypothetical protein [Kingella potus]|uniref:hypothetical protein n=1 Tax=Kingella potus TaxID=265175 RepID=UPI001FD15A9B|nr:hypothetical protein [Kingella potus]UOP01220.1 hypothetical protein LVJ84_02720 [Kingella potus]
MSAQTEIFFQTACIFQTACLTPHVCRLSDCAAAVFCTDDLHKTLHLCRSRPVFRRPALCRRSVWAA